HGVAAHAPVSAYASDVTAAMVAAFDRDVATMSVFARHVGAGLEVVDVGVGQPTGDIRHESALTPERFDDITRLAFDTVDALDTDLLVLGELGIGNTTVSAAIASALMGGEVTSWVGPGSGVEEDGLAAKRDAVQTALRRIAGVIDPLEILREVGGAELVGMAAAVVAARHRSIPVVLDGYISTASALPLQMTDPSALDHCIVGHCSSEPGHRLLLDRIGKPPLLDLDMRLGEGSGAMAAVPLVRLACAGVVEVPTFGEFFGDDATVGDDATS
ncbi:MAG: nicotinate-nucleotide--dimethylbenzimidazole phosphoribosyltransferase, partial [Actinomycetota bacterium]